jgi:hypothetical protein
MEFFESFFSAIRDRLKKPFFGAFILSFIAYNWRAFYYLIFAEGKVGDRIAFVDTNYLNDNCFLLCPILFALGYMLTQAYLHWGIDRATSFAESKRKFILQERRIEELNNQVARAKIEKEVQDARSGNLTLAELNIRNENLTKEIEILTKKYNLESEQKNAISEELNLKVQENIVLSDNIKNTVLSYDNVRGELVALNNENSRLEKALENAKVEIENLTIEKNILHTKMPRKEESEDLWKKMVERNLNGAFIQTYRSIKSLGSSWSDFDPIQFEQLSAMGLLKVERDKFFEIKFLPTDLGEKLWSYYLLEISMK